MIEIISEKAHSRGRIYEVSLGEKKCQILMTFHALERAKRWRLSVKDVIRALVEPKEVIKGHHDRFIAHSPTNGHLIRVIYEYEENTPVVVTIYCPRKDRYYQGGGIYEDRVLGRC